MSFKSTIIFFRQIRLRLLKVRDSLYLSSWYIRNLQVGKSSVRGRIAIYKPDRLGDFVLAIGAISQLASFYKDYKIVLFVSIYSEEFAKIIFPNISVVALEEGVDSYRGNLARISSAVGDGVEISISLRYHLSAPQQCEFFSIPSQKHLYLEHSGIDLYFPSTVVQKYPYSNTKYPHSSRTENLCTELVAHKRLLETIFGESLPEEKIVPRLDKSCPTRDEVLLSPFASSAIRSVSPFEIARIFDEIHQQIIGKKIVVCCPETQRSKHQRFCEMFESISTRKIDLRITNSISELFESISSAALIVTADTAPAHIATALDLPAIIFLGGGHYGTFGPWRRSQKQIWLSKFMNCFGCNWNCCRDRVECLEGLSLLETDSKKSLKQSAN